MTPKEPEDTKPSAFDDPTPAQLQIYLEVSTDPAADLDALHDMILRRGLSVLDYRPSEKEVDPDAEEERRQRFPRYLVALTRRRAIDRFRSQVRDGVGQDAPDAVDHRDPADAVILQTEALVLIAALEQLRPADRSLLASRAAGTPLAEMARLERVTPATVRKRYQRALERLREKVASIDPSLVGPLPEDPG